MPSALDRSADDPDGPSGARSDGFASGVRTRFERYRNLQFTDPEIAAMLLAPVVAYLVAVSYYPIAATIWTSLHDNALGLRGPPEFVGLENYRSLLSNGSFWNSLKVSLIYTGVSVPIELALGMGIALLVNRRFKGKFVAQAAILFPWALPTIINARIWQWLYHGEYGVFNDMLLRVGLIESPYAFLAHPTSAMAAMLVVTIWKTSSFMALILLAGLQSIPEHLYEAAEMDGTSRWQRFTDITLPLLKPTILVALIFRTLPAFQAFGLPYGLTGGGPGESTTTLVLFDHRITFSQLAFGEGSAAATVITLIALAISMVYVSTLYEPEVR
ncbi:carbohydrate ABC transporter permease [Halegenticoccus soli]|uniref:carbohydrate ABC transporter permease n=1 Tax=Halegenticoccus soli TaxID=1985678 RepID=UPI000C6D54C9|nr:sugar ABC transporter permease [Halegenticoccus soli]